MNGGTMRKTAPEGLEGTVHDPPSWEILFPLLWYALALFGLSFVLALEQATLLKHGITLSHLFQQYSSRRTRSAGKDGWWSRFTEALFLFRSNVAYLRGAQPVIFQGLLAFKSLLSIWCCVVYVYGTYTKHVPADICFFMNFMGVLFLLSHVFRICTEDAPLTLVFSMYNIFECLTLPSLLLMNEKLWLSWAFFRAYNVYETFHQVGKSQMFDYGSRYRVTRRIVELVVQSLVYLYIVASGLQVFELVQDPTEHIDAATYSLSFVNSMYFATITALTVGYGDFVPRSTLGRAWVVLVVFAGAYAVSVSVGAITDTLNTSRSGGGSFYKLSHVKHIVVCGCIQWEYLKQLLLEFYSDEVHRNHRVVVLSEEPNWTKDTWTRFKAELSVPASHLVFLQGSGQNKDDLIRAQAGRAEAVFVLARPHSKDPRREDTEVTKHILALRTYNASVRIYAMCILRDSVCAIEDVLQPQKGFDEPESTTSVGNGSTMSVPDGQRQESTQKLVCMEQVETLMVAENVFCNGLSTIAMNGFTRIHPNFDEDDSPWVHEYKLGAECDFHNIVIPEGLSGYAYQDIAVYMYDFGAVLVAFRMDKRTAWDYFNFTTVLRPGMEGLFLTYFEDVGLQEKLDDLVNFLRLRREAKLSLRRRRSTHNARRSSTDSLRCIVGGAVTTEKSAPIGLPRRGSRRSMHEEELANVGKGLARPQSARGEPSKLPGSKTAKNRTPKNQTPTGSPRSSPVIRPKTPAGSVAGSLPRRDSVLLQRALSGATRRNSSRDPSKSMRRPSFALASEDADSPAGPSPLQSPRNLTADLKFKVYHDTNLPVHLRRHLIVCMIGSVSLIHFENLIDRVLRKRCGHKRTLPVVAIRKSFPQDFQQEMSRYKEHLYLLQGSCQNIDTLERAQFKDAKAVIVLAMDEWKEKDELDARTLLTLMTLDSVIPESSSTYVCTIVDAEDSIRLLRPPNKARRRGVQLGEIQQPVILPKRQKSKAKRMSSTTSVTSMGSTQTSNVLVRKSSWFRNFSFVNLNPENMTNYRNLFVSNLRETFKRSQRRESATIKRLIDHKRRAVTERQRYASGEICINTHIVSAIVRDFCAPGVIDFLFSKMIINENEKDVDGFTDSWWRQVDVPKEYIELNRPRIVTYREVFLRLLNVGVVPIGLYRSGDAKVRMQKRSMAATKDDLASANSDEDPRGGIGRRVSDTFYNDDHRRQGSGSFFGFNKRDRKSTAFGSGAWTLDEEMRALTGEMGEGLQKYVCPTTRKVVEYQELLDGENTLPYVYTNPEPYTALAATDGIFLICDPRLEIPPDWYKAPLAQPFCVYR